MPKQLKGVIIVLLYKGDGNYRGIGLLEPAWKVVELIMDARLQVRELNDSLHGFTVKRGTGTMTIKVKLAQQLAHMDRTPCMQSSLTFERHTTPWTGVAA